MGLTLAEKAERITCIACSVATNRVNVVTFEPFVVHPMNLFNKKFSEVDIVDDAVVTIFTKAAAELIPLDQNGRDIIQGKILAQAVDTNKKIQLFSDFLEAILAEQEAANR